MCLILVNDVESGLTNKTFLFSAAETGDNHKQVESRETGNTSEQPGFFFEELTADHQGRLTKI